MRLKLFLLIVIVLLTGCSAFDTVGETFSGISNYFSGGEDNADPPSPLVVYKPEVQPEILWKESVGVGADEHSLKLVPAIAGDKILAADREGLVQARNLGTGKLIWKTETGVHFSGGPGLGEGTLILGSSDADVVALNIETGAVLWKSAVSSEVLSVPVVSHNIVVVRTTDGVMIALDEKTGGKRWRHGGASGSARRVFSCRTGRCRRTSFHGTGRAFTTSNRPEPRWRNTSISAAFVTVPCACWSAPSMSRRRSS